MAPQPALPTLPTLPPDLVIILGCSAQAAAVPGLRVAEDSSVLTTGPPWAPPGPRPRRGLNGEGDSPTGAELTAGRGWGLSWWIGGGRASKNGGQICRGRVQHAQDSYPGRHKGKQLSGGGASLLSALGLGPRSGGGRLTAERRARKRERSFQRKHYAQRGARGGLWGGPGGGVPQQCE